MRPVFDRFDFDVTSPLVQYALGIGLAVAFSTALAAGVSSSLSPDATEITGSIPARPGAAAPDRRVVAPAGPAASEPPLWTWVKNKVSFDPR